MKLPQRPHTSPALRVGCLAQTAPPGFGGEGATVSDLTVGAPVDVGGGAPPPAPASMSTANTARQLGQVNCPPPGTSTTDWQYGQLICTLASPDLSSLDEEDEVI